MIGFSAHSATCRNLLRPSYTEHNALQVHPDLKEGSLQSHIYMGNKTTGKKFLQTQMLEDILFMFAQYTASTSTPEISEV